MKELISLNKAKTMKQLILLLVLLTFGLNIQAQSINGSLPQHGGQTIALTGFNYYDSNELATTIIDSLGNFTLVYPKDYKGMGILNTQDNSSLVVALTETSITLTGTHLKEPDSLRFINCLQNQQFSNYAKSYTQTTQAYKAWRYLQPLYAHKNSMLANQRLLKKIDKEITRLEVAPAKELSKLDKKSYLQWFLSMRTLVSDMPATIYSYTERVPQNVAQFRNIDFNNPYFKTSGLFKELIEGHYFLLENSSKSLDDTYVRMSVSTQYLIDNLQGNDELLNMVSDRLFTYFEKHSLYKASEYLSLSLLNNNQCSLDDNLANKLESYRKMKVGSIAPDILLKDSEKLSAINTPKLVVFGASWCPTCKTDSVELMKYYDAWQLKGVKIVYISIDTDKATYEVAYKNAPWQTYCDYKGWDTQAAKDYYITGTPSYFLLDATNKILVRPNSVAHANAWIVQKL